MIEKNKRISIPQKGEQPDSILQQIEALQQKDIAWKEGSAWSLVYYVDETHDQLLKDASNAMFSTNYLNPLAFKSLHKMEQEVVQMAATMLHAPPKAVGVMTSGGTESLILAMYGSRQRARKLTPQIINPEVVSTATIHPAFDKAASLLGITIRKSPVDENRCAIPGAMEKLINDNTILITASAPGYPNGALDPIEAIAGIAKRYRLPFHVDACIGGFMLPWVEKLGYDVPLWDYRVPGVTSISADVHKFGYGAKGASVLTYISMEYMNHQFMISTDFPGGIYISPTLLGTRPGGPIAAAWAGMKHLGEAGYMELAKKLMEGTKELKTGLTSITGITLVGKPCMNILSYTTINNKPDIFVIADQMEDKGWMMDRQQFPDCIHITILPTNLAIIDRYLKDLKDAVKFASENRGASAKGNAAIYGLMARIPFRGIVEKSVKKIMEDMYGHETDKEADEEENPDNTLADNPAWMGSVNRFLSAWKRWKRYFRFGKK